FLFNPSQPPTLTLFPYTTLFRSEYNKLPGIRAWQFVFYAFFFLAKKAFKIAINTNKVPLKTKPPLASSAKAPVMLEPPTTPIEKDRKSTRLNSSHVKISYAVFCL